MAYIALRNLNIDDATRARALELRQYAFEHRESLTDRRNRTASGQPLPDAERFSMDVPVGYHVAYTVEQRLGGWVQLISVFHSTPRLTPHPPTVARLVEELFDIHPAKNPVPGRGSGVLAEAVEISEQRLPNGCIAVNLVYKFDIPECST